ncbi:MAG: DUF4301 family protein [Prevotellaceae bacterium]|jgi:hypothetical protein|nr:DUF4301 family protein [Prevotellaceae bacterium]
MNTNQQPNSSPSQQLSNDDRTQLARLGVDLAQAEQQLQNFCSGFPFLSIIAPATPGKGVTRFDHHMQTAFVQRFDRWDGSRLKFVPASGAATRMCKALFEAKTQWKRSPHDDALSPECEMFFASLHKFAFYDRLKTLPGVLESDRLSVVRALLDEEGLNYCNLPKGLLLFHRYRDGVRTPFEEHLVEAALYARDAAGVARLHFTVSPEHRAKFVALTEAVVPDYEKKYGVRFEIRFSEQKKSTDTIAADEHNAPFRNPDGALLFRPGGHGALLENLNEITESIVFIKNIDNVVIEPLNGETIHWKKVLAGYLLYLRERIHAGIVQIERGAGMDELKEIERFLSSAFCITLPDAPPEEYAARLRNKLNRPLRVCGMVKNVGEPGGGPFIVRHADGSSSLQIAESVQLDLENPEVNRLFHASTHFNPVDLVCSFSDYKGGRFHLPDFRDPATGLITLKSKDGRILKAQELPGLWNGAMSDWNTAFVETPLITFNPVKTLNDLLRKEHQCADSPCAPAV